MSGREAWFVEFDKRQVPADIRQKAQEAADYTARIYMKNPINIEVRYFVKSSLPDDSCLYERKSMEDARGLKKSAFQFTDGIGGLYFPDDPRTIWLKVGLGLKRTLELALHESYHCVSRHKYGYTPSEGVERRACEHEKDVRFFL